MEAVHSNVTFMDRMFTFFFSPLTFYRNLKGISSLSKFSWLMFFLIFLCYMSYCISIFPAIHKLTNKIFLENDMDYSSNIENFIFIITLMFSAVQFISSVLVSFFLLHMIGILVGGSAKTKEFFSYYIFATLPIGIKFFVLTVFALIFGSDFAFSFAHSSNNDITLSIISFISDPFFWWSTILGCIALKESHNLSYKKSIIVTVVLLLLGSSSFMLVKLI
ncbi:YIP1 family protein [Bacillus cereus]|uniref:YIP1 family protein n=1 Tax=Bacillus TaxID=1386 RepID=UPI0018CF5AC0|nr:MULTISPECIES: YIP1 family protein [Bacillus cereus group]MBG9522303.1 hypothetical protein [Bacillus thuringiensis]MBG9616743.1 hypothetical protein [Bacillus cereus]MDA2164197.1 YIP1 family protein [Bacillus cereus group sp. Bc252]MED3468323.1 YIP1 family protein [Bacillus thuringiensis]HDR3897070.1 YIP1 family protein [Bacillus cereus]